MKNTADPVMNVPWPSAKSSDCKDKRPANGDGGRARPRRAEITWGFSKAGTTIVAPIIRPRAGKRDSRQIQA
ncbi:hypothetical protein Rhe02_21270 [Rhizocola hellebori]|uniref:Uncharacterized protein n=1 Tax=Rhizocola hellebori TaxID=1392758 RepID=A0A8J3VEZ5_9ACTN|nr:hypothetical protein Rhe02_21270 [Rhizocola hellebori]